MAEAPGPTGNQGTRGLLALGFTLARRGPVAITSFVLAGVITFGAVTLTFVLARSGTRAPLAEVPALSASVLAWGAGVLLAFASAAHALRRDQEEGIRALLRARGGSARSYLLGRTLGLIALLALVVGGGTLIISIAATALARPGSIARAAQGSAAAIVYACAFAAVVGPLALATLGARSRIGGYFSLFGVLILPELFHSWTSKILPYSWREFTSVPSALAALRSALSPPGVDIAQALRAVVVLAVVSAIALLIVHRQAMRVEAGA